ncbi:MAG: MFS transporter [Lachnospiraceae bacterium]|nr:MFS transporter [Lachnospiraceae bacterium]
MVILDFATAILTFLCMSLLGRVNLVILILVVLICLYGIQGAYSPSIQASIPALVGRDELMPANAVVTLVNSLAGLIGPVIGGAVYGFYGILPVLFISMLCFLASAVMEIFIHIPYKRGKATGNIFQIVKTDMREGIQFVRNEKTILAKVPLLIAAVNMVFSALLIIGLPVVITQKLGFGESLGNRLYGYCEGAMATGGLLGGLLSGVLAKKISIRNGHMLIFACSFLMIPIGAVLVLPIPEIVSYLIIVICCFLMIIASTFFSIEMMAYAQAVTPADLVGKIMSIAMCLCMCASPLGQAIYGWLFQILSEKVYFIFFVAAVLSGGLGIVSKKSFEGLTEF